MPRAQRRRVEADARERLQPRIVREKDVGSPDQRVQDTQIVALLRVELDAALVAIDGEEVRALAFEERRPPAARLIAVAGPFHFDDVGT